MSILNFHPPDNVPLQNYPQTLHNTASNYLPHFLNHYYLPLPIIIYP